MKVTTGILPEWVALKKDQDEQGKPKEGVAQFFLRPLNGPETLIAQDECFDPVKRSISGRGYTQILGMGLQGWKGVLDESGNAVPFNGPADIKLLPFAVIAELAAKIVAMSAFSEARDGKN